jgi:hypothetical protein
MLILAFSAWGYAQDECLECHRPGGSSSLMIDAALYMSSVHAKEGIICSDCHTSITGDEHFSTKGQGKADCGSCHPEQIKSPDVPYMLTAFHIVSHPKQDAAMAADKTMCVGCHQGQAAHGEKIAVNKQNCYKCHSPFDKNSVLFGYIHNTGWKNRPAIVVSTFISLAGLIVVILLVAGCFTNSSGKRGDGK